MKKFTTMLLVLAMLCTMMSAMIPTASAAWDGSTVSAGLVGTGTETDPYLISSENDLAFVAKQVNEGNEFYADQYLKLTVDLDLGNQNWIPIGMGKPNYFKGNFDGDGHTISNLTCKTEDGNSNAIYAGVFGRTENAVIKNLNVENADLVSAKYAGAIVGQLTCVADGGYGAVINCHVTNINARGLQIGGVVGRSSQSKATKGQLQIIGCTANNITMNPLSDTDFTASSISFGNHFIGGIVGGAGQTVITGCGVTNMTALAYGTSFAPVGGIVGVQGADSGATDVTNCYAIGINLAARADSHATKTQLGGLIGKMAHVAVVVGDANTEYNVFNCFVADVTAKNETGCASNGVVVGLVNDTINFNDVYYVPAEGLNSYGEDKYFTDYPFMQVNGVSELTAATLNKGNSTAVWVDDAVKGHPVIDSAAAEANQPTYVDYFIENQAATTEPEVTDAPVTTEGDVVTTEAPDATTEEVTEEAPSTDAPTEAPAQTDSPDTEPVKSGCGGMLASGAAVIVLLGAAIVFKKRR